MCLKFKNITIRNLQKIAFNLLFLLCVSSVFGRVSPTLNSLDRDYVLIINSYIETAVWPNYVFDAVKNDMTAANSTQRLYRESLNLSSVTSKDVLDTIAHELVKKYSERTPEVIIIVGEPAWITLKEVIKKAWTDVPIILCSINDYVTTPDAYLQRRQLLPEEKIPLEESVKGYNLTVVRYPIFVKETISLMKRLLPEMKRLYFISDRRYASSQARPIIHEVNETSFPNLEVVYLTEGECTLGTVLDSISKAAPNSGFLYYSWRSIDHEGNDYALSNAYKAMSTFDSHMIFTLEDIGINEGYMAGGYFCSGDELGETVVSLLKKVLSGHKILNTPSVMAGEPRNTLCYHILRAAGISSELYPKGAKYYFVPESFWHKNRYPFAIATFLGLVTLLLFSRIMHLRKLEIMRQREIQILAEAKELAEQSNKLKSAFLANMSHEIRTPLNAIVGFSNVLMITDNKEEQKEFMKIIEYNNNILLQLVNDIIDISEIESDTMQFDLSIFDLSELIEELAMFTRTRINAVESEINVIIENEFPTLIICQDKKMLRKVFMNLINNALKFTQKGHIRFGYKLLPGDIIRMYVEDTGCGILAEDQDTIFERFVKLDEFAQGTGLGLSVCKTIVTKMGGEIGVDSQVGAGATFWFTIPYTPYNEEEQS